MQRSWNRPHVAPELALRGKLLDHIVPDFQRSPIRASNLALRALRGHHRKDLTCEEVMIPGGRGPLRLCVYRRAAERSAGAVPGLLWLHGGGYALGLPELEEGFFTDFLQAADCVIAVPDYCRSDEAPYPAALEDCYAALCWLYDQAQTLGVRRDRLMVGGDSAGGGLAAAVCILARDRGGPKLSFQMPLYPMLDDRMETPSARDNRAPVWNSARNRAAWKLYLGARCGAAELPPTAAPGRLTDYSGLPPAFSFVGTIEPFRDETTRYFQGLRAAGIPAKLELYPGCFHGFDQLCPQSRAAQQARAALRRAFAQAAED